METCESTKTTGPVLHHTFIQGCNLLPEHAYPFLNHTRFHSLNKEGYLVRGDPLVKYPVIILTRTRAFSPQTWSVDVGVCGGVNGILNPLLNKVPPSKKVMGTH